jgi:hypothetical protein
MDFRKRVKYKISCEFVQWEPSCYIQTDGRTDIMMLIVAFRNFAKVPKNRCQNLIKIINKCSENYVRMYYKYIKSAIIPNYCAVVEINIEKLS